MNFINIELAYSIVFTIVMIVIVIIARVILARKIRGKNTILSEAQRISLSKLSNYSIAIIIVLFVLIWAVQLKSFALSLAAFAVAIVIAFKEVILCVSGSIVLASGAKSFKIGDWIEVGAYHGEVIGQNLISTTLQEFSSTGNKDYTGRTVVLPNSIFLSQSLMNLNFNKKYVFHSFEILYPDQTEWPSLKPLIEKEVNNLVYPFIETAIDYNARIEKESGVDMPDVDPVIYLRTGHEGKIFISIKLFCPRELVEGIQSKLIETVISHSNKN